jgi:hypothetical protein
MPVLALGPGLHALMSTHLNSTREEVIYFKVTGICRSPKNRTESSRLQKDLPEALCIFLQRFFSSVSAQTHF